MQINVIPGPAVGVEFPFFVITSQHILAVSDASSIFSNRLQLR